MARKRACEPLKIWSSSQTVKEMEDLIFKEGVKTLATGRIWNQRF